MPDLTYTQNTAAGYSQNLLGSNFTVNSATFSGRQVQIREYSGGDANSPLVTPGDTGIVMSTGRAADFNDNNLTNNGLSRNFGDGPAPTNYNNLTTDGTFDDAVLTMNFTANRSGEFILNLTFLTDEFPDFVGTGVSDIGAVFFQGNLVNISGTNNGYFDVDSVPTGPFLNNGPNGSANTLGTDFNAIKTGQTAPISVVAGQSYTLQIGVTDVGDSSVDSALMISSSAVTFLCFCQGALISTPNGPVAVENLKKGDRVITMDHGAQTLRWVGSSRLGTAALGFDPRRKPVRIRAGALGDGLPASDLLVSRQHRVLVRSPIAKRIFGATEVLVPAIKLVGVDGIEIAEDCDDVIYFHLLFDRHEIVFANNAPCESLYTGREAIKALSFEAQDEIHALFPFLDLTAPDTARPIPQSGRDAKALAMRHQKNSKPLLGPPT